MDGSATLTALRDARRYLRWRCRDALANRRHARAVERFLVLRHPGKRTRFYDAMLRWIADEWPDVRARFELRVLPFRPRARYRLCLPWLQDPVRQWSPRTYERARAAGAACGAPTINPVEKLVHAGKAAGAERMRAAGVRVPRAERIIDEGRFRETRLGIPLPLLVREDWGHARADAIESGAVVRCDTMRDVRALDLSRFARPVAIEIVDVRCADGLFRKYRYVAAGDLGVPHHLQAKEHWFVKGRGQVYSETIRDEDLAYLSAPDPHHELFQRARRALELDVAAFDYAIGRDGEPVVFEANPFPTIHFLPGRRAYRDRAVIRTIAALVHLYHERAGLPVPDGVRRRLEYDA